MNVVEQKDFLEFRIEETEYNLVQKDTTYIWKSLSRSWNNNILIKSN